MRIIWKKQLTKDRYVVSACRIVFISGSVDYMKYDFADMMECQKRIAELSAQHMT